MEVISYCSILYTIVVFSYGVLVLCGSTFEETRIALKKMTTGLGFARKNLIMFHCVTFNVVMSCGSIRFPEEYGCNIDFILSVLDFADKHMVNQ